MVTPDGAVVPDLSGLTAEDMDTLTAAGTLSIEVVSPTLTLYLTIGLSAAAALALTGLVLLVIRLLKPAFGSETLRVELRTPAVFCQWAVPLEAWKKRAVPLQWVLLYGCVPPLPELKEVETSVLLKPGRYGVKIITKRKTLQWVSGSETMRRTFVQGDTNPPVTLRHAELNFNAFPARRFPEEAFMKRQLRSRAYLAFLSLALVLLLCGVPAARHAAADQLRVPKVISILYDDSGSMVDSYEMLGKAGYARYAVNALLALLDTQDVVYVTLMSHPDTAFRLDMAAGQAQAIAQLNAMIGNDDTPFSALGTAIETLGQVQAADASSLYWLVVFTDGGFDGGSIADAEQALENFLRTPMPNGTFPQACFVSIGSDAARPQRAIDGLTLYPAYRLDYPQ